MNKKQCLKVFGLVLVSFLLFNILPSNSSPVSPNVALDDLPAQATYTIKTDGVGNYWAVRYDGYIAVESTNSTAVFDYVIQTNTTVLVTEGMYSINNLLMVDVSRFHLVGQNWGAQLTIGASGGFNISSATLLRDIVFEDIWWEGGGTAIRAITSAMPLNTRITEFRFLRNRVNDFRGAGAIGLNLSNLENSEISYNTWYRTRIAHIQMTTNGYDSGNIRIEGNEFYAGYDQNWESAVKIITKKHTGPGSGGQGGGVQAFVSKNHYLYVTYFGYAWNITTWEGKSSVAPQFDNERSEGGGFIFTKARNQTFFIKGLKITGSQLLNTAFTNVRLINLGEYTWNSIIANNYLLNTGTGGATFMDNVTSLTNYNIFADNWVASTAGFRPSVSTCIHGNVGISGNYTVKTEGSDNIRYSTSIITNYGATASGIASKTIYTIHSSDMYLNVSGGTVSNIKIYDPSGTEIADFGSNAEFVLIPRLFQFNITWTVEPTMKFLWTQ